MNPRYLSFSLTLVALATVSGCAQDLHPNHKVIDLFEGKPLFGRESDAGAYASFQAFLPQFEEATSRFINGDPALWKQLSSNGNDVTIMAGWGAYEKGWAQVGLRYDWAAARFVNSDAKVSVEYLSSAVSGELAYTVAIERCSARLVGLDKPAAIELRVTNVFRREHGEWKLVHHHSDSTINKTPPTAVLQK